MASGQFDSLLNFRDVGLSINALCGTNFLIEGRLFRGARPDEASAEDRKKLANEVGIKTVIDLRSKTEHLNQAKKRDASLRCSSLVPQSESQFTQPLKIPGLDYHEINLNGGAFERALLRQLNWFSFGKLMFIMALGYRNEGIGILGREVMQERGLIGLGIDTLDFSREEIRQVFSVLSDSDKYPVMVHCTQGKDRTGLIVLLVLLLVGSPLHAISKDYVLSESELLPEKEDRMKEIRSIGLTDDFAGCLPDFVEKVTEHINKRYGGISKYLFSVGVDLDHQRRLRTVLLS